MVRVPGLCILLLSASATAGDLNGQVTLTSEYVYRGLDLSDGRPALQASLDYEFSNGFFAGAWTSSIDFGDRDLGHLEFDVYAGYHHSPIPPLDLSIALIRRTYPGQPQSEHYEYTEATLAATLLGRYTLEYGYTDDLYGTDYASHHWEARADWPVRGAWVISGGAGYNDLSELYTSNYWYWDVGATARISWLTVDLRWYDSESLSGYYGPLAAGSKLVLSLSTGF